MTPALPGYERRGLRPTIVHIGPGVFHRAHQAVYSDRLLQLGVADGAIWGISLRSADVRDALVGDGYRYPVIERSQDAEPADTVTTVGSILGITVATEDRDDALRRLGVPDVAVVTVTVTEKGYCAVEPGGPLDVTRPEVVHDLAHPTAPRSLPGLIVEALARRRAAGVAPFTVASCDNLPANGQAVARVVTELAELRDPKLGAWITGNVAFPSSMVDRMVPATTSRDRAWCREQGISGAWPVVTEPFTQWVLEDLFPAGRPDWGSVGVELVGDVSAHERAKLRILNAAHSALAYWGVLAGHDFIWQAVSDPVLLLATNELIHGEVIPTLETPYGWNLSSYASQVLERFANRALPYTTAKVAGDGSQKLPVRLIPTIIALSAAGRRAPRSAQILAAWVTTMFGPNSALLAVDDPALDVGPAGELIRRSRNGVVPVHEAVDLMRALPGFAVPDHQFWTAVTTTARRFWQADDASDVLAVHPDPHGEETPHA